MSIAATYNLFLGILLLVLAGFIAVPAWDRWKRNLALVHVGVRTTGRYHGDCKVTFSLESGQQITFLTWWYVIRFTNLGDILPVIYDPANPGRAEVRTRQALWDEPFGNLVLAVTYAVTAVLLFRGTNLALALFLSLGEMFLGYPLLRLIFYGVYPPASLKSRARNKARTGSGRHPGKQQDLDDDRIPEAMPGPGRRHSRQQRRLQRQLEWKELPHDLEPEDSLVAEVVEEQVNQPARRREARDQLLLDMISLPDDSPDLSETSEEKVPEGED